MSDPIDQQGAASMVTPAASTAGSDAVGADAAATTAVARADLLRRFLALLIDGVVAAILSRIPLLGGILAALYILLRDGFEFEFMERRSLGKRIMRLRPVCDDGSPVTLAVSARRNWPLVVSALPIVLLLIPILGWLLIPLAWVAGLVLIVVEGVLTVTDGDGRRWGDRLAGTRVIETDA